MTKAYFESAKDSKRIYNIGSGKYELNDLHLPRLHRGWGNLQFLKLEDEIPFLGRDFGLLADATRWLYISEVFGSVVSKIASLINVGAAPPI